MVHPYGDKVTLIIVVNVGKILAVAYFRSTSSNNYMNLNLWVVL